MNEEYRKRTSLLADFLSVRDCYRDPSGKFDLNNTCWGDEGGYMRGARRKDGRQTVNVLQAYSMGFTERKLAEFIKDVGGDVKMSQVQAFGQMDRVSSIGIYVCDKKGDVILSIEATYEGAMVFPDKELSESESKSLAKAIEASFPERQKHTGWKYEVTVEDHKLVKRSFDTFESEERADDNCGRDSDGKFGKDNTCQMMGIGINDKNQDFTGQILSGVKTSETRDTNSLKPYIGKTVGIVRTGRGKEKATLVGTMKIGEPKFVATKKEFDSLYDSQQVAPDSDRYIGERGKYIYPLTEVKPVRPVVLKTPAGRIARKLHPSQRDVHEEYDLDESPEDYMDEQRTFCPTGDGGGIDNTCGDEGGGASTTAASEKTSFSEKKAISEILDGKKVSLDTVRDVNTVLSKLADMATNILNDGKTPPVYDLCKVTVPGTNLFCGENLDIDRADMPQAKGKPVPGSPADKLDKDKFGKVDATKQFLASLRGEGFAIGEPESVPASSLKATQKNMQGENVARMMKAKDFDPAEEPIFVSKDGYVVDGHHRWAAVVGRDSADGKLGQSKMNVQVIDAPIRAILKAANKFTSEFGIERAKVAAGGKRSHLDWIQAFVDVRAFCPTGASGGVDNSCGSGGASVSVSQKGTFLQSTTKDGVVGGHVKDGALRISVAQLDAAKQGKGLGKAMYAKLIDDAHKQGLKVYSDTTVEVPAARVYKSLEKDGYQIVTNPHGVLPPSADAPQGALYGTGNEPVFEVRPKKADLPPMSSAEASATLQNYRPFIASSERNSDYTHVPTDDTVRSYLKNSKDPEKQSQKDKLGASRELPSGSPVALRIDIPVFNNSEKDRASGVIDRAVYAVSVHNPGKAGQAFGKIVGYDSLARLDGEVVFSADVGKSTDIASGKTTKLPVAVVHGKFDPSREIPKDVDSWTAVGFDPFKATYFYDKKSGREVVGGVHAVSVGNTVFTKTAKYGTRNAKTDFRSFEVRSGDNCGRDPDGQFGVSNDCQEGGGTVTEEAAPRPTAWKREDGAVIISSPKQSEVLAGVGNAMIADGKLTAQSLKQIGVTLDEAASACSPRSDKATVLVAHGYAQDIVRFVTDADDEQALSHSPVREVTFISNRPIGDAKGAMMTSIVSIGKDDEDVLSLNYALLGVSPEAQASAPTAVAREMYQGVMDSVDAAEKIGVEEIVMQATGSRTDSKFKGYRIWPRLGFDGTIPRNRITPTYSAKWGFFDAYGASLPDSALSPKAKAERDAGALTIQSLYETAEGQNWWEKHGGGMDLKLRVGDKKSPGWARFKKLRDRLSRNKRSDEEFSREMDAWWGTVRDGVERRTSLLRRSASLTKFYCDQSTETTTKG